MANETGAQRDPRVGDVYQLTRVCCIYMRHVRGIRGNELIYQDGFQQACATTVKQFKRWAKNAEVIHRAD